MIPTIPIITQTIEDQTHPNETYHAVATRDASEESDVYRDRIKGFVNDLSSIEQAIYIILGTERYKFPIYSWDYGVELIDLYGKPMPYVMAELPVRIKDALLVDNRISDVMDFKFTKKGKKLGVSFTVITNAGNINSGLEVEV